MNRNGFTLLETMIAMAIMVVAFGSILLIQSQSLDASAKAKQLNTASMLAKNLMIESEETWEGRGFGELKEEEQGQFPAPHEDFKWKRVVKEIKLPELASLNSREEQDGGSAPDQSMTMVSKLVTQYLSKAVREVTVTVSWQRGSGEQNYAISTYWVNLNEKFQLSQ